MNKLEVSSLPLNNDQTLNLLKGLEEMAEGLISGIEKTAERVANVRFQSKDYQLKVKQDFHSLLALADRQFMEHVSAKVEPEAAEQSQTQQSAEQAGEAAQKTIDKLKEAALLSMTSCGKFMEQETKKQAERGDMSARNSSMTSLSLFQTMRSDVQFPPIVDSNDFKNSKYLGLCKKLDAPVAPTEPQTPTSSTDAGPSPVLANSTSFGEIMNISIPTPGMPQQSMSIPTMPSFSMSAPVNMPPPPRAGVIPPPPAPNVAQLYKIVEQRQKQIKEARKSGGSYNPTGAVDEPEQDLDDGLNYKDKLARMLSRNQQQAGPGSSNQPQQYTSQFQDEPTSVRKSVLSSGLGVAGVKGTGSGFFDDGDEDEGGSLLQKSRLEFNAPKPTVTSSRLQFTDTTNEQPTSQGREQSGTMLDSILKKKNKPTEIEEANPFAPRRQTKAKASIFAEEEQEEETKPAKQSKFDAMMVDSDDEDKQKKLIQKYSKGKPEPEKPKRVNKLLVDSDQEEKPATKKAPVEEKKKKSKVAESSDEELPLPGKKPPAKKTDDKKKLGFSSDDEPIKMPPRKAPTKDAEEQLSTKKSKVNSKDVEDEVPIKKPKAPPKVESEDEIIPPKKTKAPVVEENKPKPVREPVVQEIVKVEPIRQSVKLDNPAPIKSSNWTDDPQEAEDDASSPPRRVSIKATDFLSKLNSQLGQGPKQGAGLIKIAGEDNDVQLEEFDENNIHNTPEYRSNRGSVDGRGSIKPLADRYFEGESPENERPVAMKKSKRGSVLIQDEIEPKEVPRKASEVVVKPIPAQEPTKQATAGPTMLRGKKKDAFANDSDEEDAPKPPAKQPSIPKETPIRAPSPPAEPQKSSGPVMLRGKKKDKFASSSGEDEPPKPVQKAPPTPDPSKASPGPGTRKNKLLDAQAEEPKFKPQPTKERESVAKPEPTKKKALLADSDDEVPAPKLPPKTAAAPKKKTLLADSDDEMPLPKKGAPKKPTMKDSDEDDKPKKAPAKAAAGKKKLFDESD